MVVSISVFLLESIQRCIQNSVTHLRRSFLLKYSTVNVNYFRRNLHLRCLTGFWIPLSLIHKLYHNNSKTKYDTDIKLQQETTHNEKHLMTSYLILWFLPNFELSWTQNLSEYTIVYCSSYLISFYLDKTKNWTLNAVPFPLFWS